jgi:hypothetical protein
MIFFYHQRFQKKSATANVFTHHQRRWSFLSPSQFFFAASRRALIRRLHEWNFMYIPARSQDEAE